MSEEEMEKMIALYRERAERFDAATLAGEEIWLPLVEIAEGLLSEVRRLRTSYDRWTWIGNPPEEHHAVLFAHVDDLYPVVGTWCFDAVAGKAVYMTQDEGPEDGEHQSYRPLLRAPTHWMELPEMPSNKPYYGLFIDSKEELEEFLAKQKVDRDQLCGRGPREDT